MTDVGDVHLGFVVDSGCCRKSISPTVSVCGLGKRRANPLPNHDGQTCVE